MWPQQFSPNKISTPFSFETESPYTIQEGGLFANSTEMNSYQRDIPKL
jgi:hypothetical protein